MRRLDTITSNVPAAIIHQAVVRKGRPVAQGILGLFGESQPSPCHAMEGLPTPTFHLRLRLRSFTKREGKVLTALNSHRRLTPAGRPPTQTEEGTGIPGHCYPAALWPTPLEVRAFLNSETSRGPSDVLSSLLIVLKKLVPRERESEPQPPHPTPSHGAHW